MLFVFELDPLNKAGKHCNDVLDLHGAVAVHWGELCTSNRKNWLSLPGVIGNKRDLDVFMITR